MVDDPMPGRQRSGGAAAFYTGGHRRSCRGNGVSIQKADGGHTGDPALHGRGTSDRRPRRPWQT